MFLTVREVADRLKVSPGCVYSLITRTELPYLRIGLGRGTIRIREDDLDRYLTTRHQGTPMKMSPQPVWQPKKKPLKHLRLP